MNLRIRTPFSIFLLTRDYVAARSLCSLRSKKGNTIMVGLLVLNSVYFLIKLHLYSRISREFIITGRAKCYLLT